MVKNGWLANVEVTAGGNGGGAEVMSGPDDDAEAGEDTGTDDRVRVAVAMEAIGESVALVDVVDSSETDAVTEANVLVEAKRG